uniref:Uncharacterized protein n=1 Tax=Haptolina ericina TaxID=156174 RepID=A0A7S3F704_9EUKA|mmetsp:Transcript_54188/g.121509  ORF Transcript_54188/g.121509 Transcript_54188/m.121509 type:complete len:464 (+) Transcript_54188:67-1458(+)|eukprot:CAMPEP_0181203696 /NCGR_PEP_ID=MMETSP1096-20121128/19533_1 /TAXON_ID=156174 ORGANISM="Chrysochromulina ericina, Strain CCMP281" /NCGR_SAMPLE_ID=MMETSP1096 /ASSEMBLY_ACC=CAM_ASM_000453 /LENGTH=463 /DNA_ID=CAMNT_0023294333 /DNA_START=67 /DNA_END=1458 /DNA_ORIENTATION=+
MTASVPETMRAINEALAGSEYECQTVSWDDVQRGTVGGGVSCWGGNITDTRLWEKNGQMLYTVRTQNWNEKLGSVSADEIALMAGGVEANSPPRPATLSDFLKSIGSHGGYAGMANATDLSNKDLDAKVSIRFQTTFLPVPDERLGALEFAPEMYNYQTRDDADPKNLLLLCTTQGSAIQQDGAGAKKLFHHAVDPTAVKGEVCRYWFEAERTAHKVGGAQKETAEEKADALLRGKAMSAVIGTRAMGTRFNVLMTIQVPLEQKPMTMLMCQPEAWASDDEYLDDECDEAWAHKLSINCLSTVSSCADVGDVSGFAAIRRHSCPTFLPAIKRGNANAARVSRGSLHDKWPGLSMTTPKRDATQHVTVTVVIYNTVTGGVPGAEDVRAAIDDMEELYRACGWTGKLASSGADFMKTELTVNDTAGIAAKMATQPYVPESAAPVGGDVFPSAGGVIDLPLPSVLA